MLRFLIPSVLFLALPASLNAQAVVAQMGDVELPASEISEILASMKTGDESLPTQDPEALDKFVRALVVQRFVLQTALAEKHDQDPAVAASLIRTRDAAIAESYLRKLSNPPADYPSKEEIATAYGENKAALLIPKAWHLAQIYIAKTEDVTVSKSRLDDVVKQLAAPGADFASIARVSSDDRSSSPSGGDLGWLQENLIQPPVRAALKDLELNAVSKPIAMEDGWHFIKLLDTREATTPTLDQVSTQLKARLRETKAQQSRQEYLSNLLEKNPPAVNSIELRKLNSKP